MNIPLKSLAGSAVVAGAVTGATMFAPESEASAAQVQGVYTVDQVVNFYGKWYVVTNPLAIQPLDYHNYIPVEPLTKTDKNGKRTANQVLTVGDKFTFSGRDYAVNYQDSKVMSLTMNGEPVWMNKNGVGKFNPSKPVVPTEKPKPQQPKPNVPNVTKGVKIGGVYKVDQVVWFQGQYYVVTNQLGIAPVDYNNYIPVKSLTVTDAQGRRVANQTLVKGSYFVFPDRNLPVTFDQGGLMTFILDGEPVDIKKSGIGSAPSVPVQPKPQPNIPVQPKPGNPQPNNPIRGVNVRAEGTRGFYNGGYSYPAYQCTGFVAQILASRGIPTSQFQFLGNGNMWAANARARGLQVNNTPRVGSVVSFNATGFYAGFGHVAYITQVHANGSFTIAEGNFNGTPYNERTIRMDYHVAGIIHF